MTTDRAIHAQISDLVNQEHELRTKLQEHEIAPDEERARLHDLEVQLDQCWDLLRQRRAKREYDQPASDAEVRSADTMEHYRG